MKRFLLLVVLVACAKQQTVTPPPPPLRPEPEPLPPKPTATAPKDCAPADPKLEPPAIAFNERSIPEGARLAEEAKGKLKLAEGAEVERALREQYTTDGVAQLITALKADPYNVTATYTLAAAYAHMGRYQCSINLLERLIQMRSHAAKKAEVETHLDKLLGRKQTLDPNFAEMRRNDQFRALIQKMCEGTNDPSCVYGAQRDNRER